MRPIRILLAGLACLALAACYSSDKPLIGDADSVADYAKITFVSPEPDNESSVFTRNGSHYVTSSHGQTVALHLKRVDGDYYVAQMSGTGDNGEQQLLYGYLHLDVPSNKAETWRTFGTDADLQAGFHKCRDAVCIDDLAVYVAYAQKAVAANEKPDTIYKVTVE